MRYSNGDPILTCHISLSFSTQVRIKEKINKFACNAIFKLYIKFESIIFEFHFFFYQFFFYFLVYFSVFPFSDSLVEMCSA
jgi:hypothetical protein